MQQASPDRPAAPDDPSGLAPVSAVPVAYGAYVFDLDGTLYLGDELLPGVEALMAALAAAGRRRVFVTNNPTRSREHYAQKLQALGVRAAPEEIVTSATLTAAWLREHQADAVCLVLGEPPLVEALTAAGLRVSEDPAEVTLVVTSFDRTFDYARLRAAFDALWRRPQTRFVATHPDAYCPLPGGRGEPDAAAVTAAVEACTGRRVEHVVGKPEPTALRTALSLVGVDVTDAIMVGDRLGTDIAMGVAAGTATALVLTGDSTLADVQAAPPSSRPTYLLDRIDALAAALETT
ncbi:HAD-IIA family hydrolase [Georgenia alba]|uniref:HAD-IIA family hydrolase n=1 Tax=Georgenia alba TaxID=2233858 RepID=A0ABW2Q8B3_9MICO